MGQWDSGKMIFFISRRRHHTFHFSPFTFHLINLASQKPYFSPYFARCPHYCPYLPTTTHTTYKISAPQHPYPPHKKKAVSGVYH